MTSPNNHTESAPWREWAKYVLLNIEDLTKGLSELEKELEEKKLGDTKELIDILNKINDIKEELSCRLNLLEKSFEVMKIKLILFSGLTGAGLMFMLDWLLDKI